MFKFMIGPTKFEMKNVLCMNVKFIWYAIVDHHNFSQIITGWMLYDDLDSPYLAHQAAFPLTRLGLRRPRGRI